jgi:hypothetical protein
MLERSRLLLSCVLSQDQPARSGRGVSWRRHTNLETLTQAIGNGARYVCKDQGLANKRGIFKSQQQLAKFRNSSSTYQVIILCQEPQTVFFHPMSCVSQVFASPS